MSLLPTRARTRGLLVASAAVAAGAVTAPAVEAYTSVSIYDGVEQRGYPGNTVAGWSTEAPSTVQVLRGGAVVSAQADPWGASDFDIQAGDVVRVVSQLDGAVLAEVPYAGKPAIVSCPGSSSFSLATDHGVTNVAAFPDETVERYSPADFNYLVGEVDAPGAGTFAGTWSSPLPAAAIVQAMSQYSTGQGDDELHVYVTVARRASSLCPPSVPVAGPKPAPPVPAANPVGLPPRQVTSPAELTRQFIQKAVEVLEKGGVAGVTKPHELPVVVFGAGTVQIQQFSGAAPKKVAAYAAAAKKKKAKPAAAPKNLLASGSKTFAKAGNGTVKVKPTKRAKALVKGKKTLAVTVRVVFTPKGGKPVATDKKITLKRGK